MACWCSVKYREGAEVAAWGAAVCGPLSESFWQSCYYNSYTHTRLSK